MQLQNEKYDGLTDKIEWTEKKYIKTSIRSWKNLKSTSMKNHVLNQKKYLTWIRLNEIKTFVCLAVKQNRLFDR